MGTGSGAQSRQMDLSAGSMGGTRQPSLFWENTNIPHSNFSVKYFAVSGSVKSFSSSHLDLLNSHLHFSAFQRSSHLLHWLSCLNAPSEAWCTHHSQSLLYGSSWIFSPRAPFQVFLVSTLPYLISALVCLQHQRTSSLILPISIICWRPTVGHLDELCDAVCTPSLLRTSSPATSSFWRTHFGSISSKTVEESLPISSNRHYLLPCPQSFLLTLLFSHSVSTNVKSSSFTFMSFLWPVVHISKSNTQCMRAKWTQSYMVSPQLWTPGKVSEVSKPTAPSRSIPTLICFPL